MDEENLDAPQDSVEFLEYVQKHQSKVDHHKNRLHKLSKLIMFLGVSAIGFMAFRHFVHARRIHSSEFSGQGHRLGASNEADEADQYKQTFNFLSVAIWGLVITKAKAGVEAASNKDANTVGGLVKKVGAICALIAAASVFQLMGTMNHSETNSAKAPKAESHKLQASNESHPASYYDKKSSHYQGGAHNVLINFAKESMAGVKPVAKVAQNNGNYGHNVLLTAAKESMNNKSNVMSTVSNNGNHGHNVLVNVAKAQMSGEVESTIPSQKSLGGSHNVAMAVLVESSRQFKKQQQQKKQVQSSGISTFFSSFGTQKVSEKQFGKNLKSTAAFVGFMITLAMCVSFFVTLKTYHAHLVKRDQLVALMKNPNARVAVGQKGKDVVKKIAAKSKALKASAAPKKVANVSDLESLIESAKAKKVLDAAKSELLLSGYTAP